jgi:CopG family transcriptional regulator/antitoxin EndoAI
VTISLPPALAAKVDRVARSEGRTRSELFREALRQYIERLERWDQIFRVGARAAQRLGLTEADVVRLVKEERRSRRR